MIWNLLLAHLLADFPLQPLWLVRSKERTWGLVVHAAVHFLTTLLMVGAARAAVWPQVLALVVFHFTVDVIKYRFGFNRPLAVAVSYFVDQAVHISSLIVVAGWISSVAPGSEGLIAPALAVYGCGYLLATHVWYVTEKTIAHGQAAYRDELQLTQWPRMLARAGLLTVVLYLGSLGGGSTVALAAPLLRRPAVERMLWLPLAATFQLPYQKDRQWRRALLTDLIVAIVTAALVRLAFNSI